MLLSGRQNIINFGNKMGKEYRDKTEEQKRRIKESNAKYKKSKLMNMDEEEKMRLNEKLKLQQRMLREKYSKPKKKNELERDRLCKKKTISKTQLQPNNSIQTKKTPQDRVIILTQSIKV